MFSVAIFLKFLFSKAVLSVFKLTLWGILGYVLITSAVTSKVSLETSIFIILLIKSLGFLIYDVPFYIAFSRWTSRNSQDFSVGVPQ